MRPDCAHSRPALRPPGPRGRRVVLAALVLALLGGPAQARNIIHGHIARDTIWTEERAPYLLTGMIELAPGAVLQVRPRVTVRFQPGARLVINGRLVAEKANFDGREAIANRERIVFHDGSTGYLRHCILENLELVLETGDVAVTDNLISNRNGSGVTVARRAAPFVSRNDFRHNSYYAVYKAGRQRLNAPDNFWGAADGPGGAGPGKGDAVNDRVDFRPFAATANGDHVLLQDFRLDQRECRPGDRLNLVFTLYNFNAFAHELILGASLRRENQAPVHSRNDDRHVRVKPGRNIFTRAFQVPDQLPEGRYDMLWGVMKDDLSTYLVLRKEFDALTVRPPGNNPHKPEGR